MAAVAALGEALRRVARAPAILAGVWTLTLLVSLPPALVLRGMLEDHLSASLASETALSGVNNQWWQEFGDQATGLGATFRPTIIGFGSVLDNLSAFLDNERRPIVIVGTATIYMVLWIFLSGGIIDRYARDRPTRAHGFFAASGVFFFRFLRLSIVMWCTYALLFGYLHPLLFGKLFQSVTREMTAERTVFAVRVGFYLAFGFLVAACNLVFDYTKVRAVVEDRRSMLGALRAAIGFIRRNRSTAVVLYLIDFALFLVVLSAYALLAPGAAGSGWSMWVGLASGELYIAARLWVKLTFWASEIALFQARLAHAGYVAAPRPVWPESPSAEAIDRA